MRRLLLAITALVILLVTGSWYWLLHSESGARWIWARAEAATDGNLQAQHITGDLAAGLRVRQLSLTTDSIVLDIRELRLIADLDLLPLQLQISEVLIDDTSVRIDTSKQAPQSSEPGTSIANLALPLSLLVKDARANNIRVSGAIAENDIVFSQAFLSAGWHEQIVIDQLRVTALGTPAITGLPETVTLQLQANGDLDKLDIAINASPVEMSLHGSVENLLESISWDVQAQLAELSLQLGENDTELRVIDGRAASSGNLDEYQLSAGARIDGPDFNPFQFATRGKGTSNSLQFSELSIRGTDVDLSGQGRVVWAREWSIESQVSVAAFNLNSLLDDWPAEYPVRGELSLLVDENHLAVSDSYLAAGDSGMSLQADARVDLAASVVAGTLRWQDARWPLLGDEPEITSKSGDISVDGSVDDWRINGDIEVGTPNMPLGRLRLDGNGDRNHIEASIIDSEVFGGKAAGHAAFNWRDQQAWSGGLNITSIDLHSFGNDLPDNISGRVDANGQMSPFLLELQLSDVNATYRGGSLSANGGVKLSNERFTASELKIVHGETRIELDGNPFSRSGLSFDVAVDDASRYLVDANGKFSAAGHLSLHAEQPSLRINASGNTFGFGEIQASGIEIVDQSDDRDVIDAEISIEQLEVNGKTIDNIAVGLSADAAAQSLRVDASYSEADIHLLLAGSFDDVLQPKNWQGELSELSLALEEDSVVELIEPVAISLSESTATIDRGCVAAGTAMRFCAQLDWSADNHLKVDADLADVPANLVNKIVNINLQFDQLVSGELVWSQSEEFGAKGDAKVTISAGTIVSRTYPDISIETEPGVLSFDTANGQLLSGEALLPMPGFGHVSAQFSITDIAEGAEGDINGLFDVGLSDLAVLAALSPFVDEANGEFSAHMTLSGSLSEPRLVGNMSVVDGSLTSLSTGLQLDEINLNSVLNEDGQAELSGDFLAGEGRGEIITRADYSVTGASGFELELRGNNMTLIEAPNLTALGDVDIRLGYDFRDLTLDGKVLISHARVNPTNLTVASHTESDDVVIVAGELPDDPLRQTRERRAWISGSLGIELGDDVSVVLGPATANLTGNTAFSWKDDLVPTADGGYDLSGSIQAFGQVLEITEGGLRFPKVPANNPFVRIRAEREIYGNVQVKTAGVLIDGTLNQFSIEPYTRPLTTEERALTLLVTGSDFDFEQGQGAIDFGTYIAPRVFVSYGVGLFETENVVRIRYDLSSSFGVTATSGEKESGVDLTYRIER